MIRKQKELEDMIAKRIDKHALDIGRTSGKARRRMAAYLLSELQKLDKAKNPEVRARNLQTMTKSVLTKLTAAGYDQIADELATYHRQTEETRKDYYDEFGVSPDDIDLSRLDTIRKQAVNNVYTGKLLLAADLKGLLKKYESGKMDFKAVTNQIQQSLNTAQNRAFTIANTSIAACDRATNYAIGEESGVESWTYMGGIIKQTRPFCRAIMEGRNPNTGEAHQNKWKTKEIRELDNGQGLPVMENAGGYNCRHSWVPDLTDLTNNKGRER